MYECMYVCIYQLNEPPWSGEVVALAEIQDQSHIRTGKPISYSGHVSLCMYVNVYLNSCKCMYVSIHVYVCMYVCMYVNVCIEVGLLMNVRMHMHI